MLIPLCMYVHIRFAVLLLEVLRIRFLVCFVPFSFHKHMQSVII